MPVRKESAIARPGDFGLPPLGPTCCLFGDKGIILPDQAQVKRAKEVPN